MVFILDGEPEDRFLALLVREDGEESLPNLVASPVLGELRRLDLLLEPLEVVGIDRALSDELLELLDSVLLGVQQVQGVVSAGQESQPFPARFREEVEEQRVAVRLGLELLVGLLEAFRGDHLLDVLLRGHEATEFRLDDRESIEPLRLFQQEAHHHVLHLEVLGESAGEEVLVDRLEFFLGRLVEAFQGGHDQEALLLARDADPGGIGGAEDLRAVSAGGTGGGLANPSSRSHSVKPFEELVITLYVAPYLGSEFAEANSNRQDI